MNLRNRRLWLIVGSVLVIILIAITILLRREPEIDVLPEEGSSQDFSTEARVVNGSEALQSVGGVYQFTSLSKDLFFFAKNTFAIYSQEPSRVVGFKINGGVKKDGNITSFAGNFGASKDRIEVSVESLKNQRIKTSIKNSKTGSSIDDKLPSNSRVNKFIASLPLDEENYTISYVLSTDSLIISINDRVPKYLEDGRVKIRQEVGEEEYKKLKLDYSFPAAGTAL